MNAKLVNSAAGVINAALTQNRTAAGIAVALESAGLLMGPDTAAELARLRQYAEHKQSREEELLATLGQYNLVASPDAWALGMTVISHLEGPHTPSTPEGLEPSLRKLIEQLRARVAELEAAPATVFRASHDSIVVGHYTTCAEARKHCETLVRREHADSDAKVSLWWRKDEDTADQPEDGEAELYERVTPNNFGGRSYTGRTGYIVTALELASEYDEEADE
ncbi:hypothetical protein [Streptomyces turgidiscabies]|uniref:hypothetical protein n=1 Tax=Streptomyces turgidiscabies TaxID=85558 RepID=UPI0038F6D766